MPVPSKGDIVIAYFPQEDQGFSDLRPCLVIAVEGDFFIAAKITTRELNRPWTYKLEAGDSSTSKGMIIKDSWVNLRRCETIKTHEARKTIATLKKDIFDTICQKLSDLLKNKG